MNDGFEDLPNVPRKALQPVRVKILQALQQIGIQSASELTDALEGNVSKGQAERHLSVLEAFGLVEPARETGRDGEQLGEAGTDTPYRLNEEEEQEGEDG